MKKSIIYTKCHQNMESDTVSEFCLDQQILDDIIVKLNEQRKNGENCDYTLKTEDGGSFLVHKCVLESVSPFFQKMFNFESIDKEKDSVLLKGCSSDVLEKIIEFMYTGEVEIPSDIAKETLDTAYFLQLNTLVDTCTQILIKTANSENCFDLLAYSETYFNGEPLAKKCTEIIGKNIDMLKDSSEFVQMSLDSVKTLCLCDRSLCNDEQLYLAIVKWVKFDMESREKYIAVLLDQIKFEETSLEFGIKEILKDKSLWKNQDYISKIMGVISENWTQQLNRNENQKIFLCFNPNNLYAVIGKKMLLYDPEIKLFSRVITEFNNHRKGFGYSTFGDKNFFVCGGEVDRDTDTSKNCCYFSLQENCWKSLPSMKFPRIYHGAITLNDKIYVCGGWGVKTVEIFDINKSKWMRGPSFNREMLLIGLCLYNENIYCVREKSLQFLDTRANKWIVLPSENTREMYSAISYNDYIYGFNREGIFTFDIRANEWLEDVIEYKKPLLSFNFPKSCIINDNFYVFGKIGKDGTFMLNSYKASNLYENVCHIMESEMEWKNESYYALFSL